MSHWQLAVPHLTSPAVCKRSSFRGYPSRLKPPKSAPQSSLQTVWDDPSLAGLSRKSHFIGLFLPKSASWTVFSAREWSNPVFNDKPGFSSKVAFFVSFPPAKRTGKHEKSVLALLGSIIR